MHQPSAENRAPAIIFAPHHFFSVDKSSSCELDLSLAQIRTNLIKV
jgi:hypothetical protein